MHIIVAGTPVHCPTVPCAVAGAVVNQQYDPEVQNPAAFIGSNVLMKCNIPTFVKSYVSVISWLQEPSFNIYPATESGKLHKCAMHVCLVY